MFGRKSDKIIHVTSPTCNRLKPYLFQVSIDIISVNRNLIDVVVIDGAAWDLAKCEW